MKALYLCLELNSHPCSPAPPSLYLCCVCPPIFISPPPVLLLLHISCLLHFLLFLPRIERSAALRRAPPLWIVGLQSTNAGDESSSHQADQACTANEIWLSHPHRRGVCCSAVSPLISSDAVRKAGDNLRGTRVAPRISNAGAGSF